jgi:hypothetical protein
LSLFNGKPEGHKGVCSPIEEPSGKPVMSSQADPTKLWTIMPQVHVAESRPDELGCIARCSFVLILAWLRR